MWSFVKITEWFQRVVSQCYDCFVLFLKYSNDTIKVHKPFFFFSHNPCYDWGVARSSIRHCLIRVRRRLLYFVFFKISFEKDPLFCGPCDLQSPLNKSIVVRELRAKQISLILAVNQLQQGKDLAVAV